MIEGRPQWLETDLMKECVTIYGQHDTRVISLGKIGVVEYCRMCGEGRYVNLKKEVRMEEGIHYHSSKPSANDRDDPTKPDKSLRRVIKQPFG